MFRELKVIIVLSLILAALFTPLDSNIVKANGMVTVATDILNVRSQPTTDSNIVVKVKRGETYSVIAKQQDWYKIKVGNQEGWVASFLVVESNHSPLPTTNQNNTEVNVLADSLRVRSGPGTNFSVIAFLNSNDKATYIEENENWVKIRVMNREGWVSKQFVSTSSSISAPETTDNTSFIGEITTNGLNIRKEPSTTSSILGSLSKGQQVTVIGQQGSWYKITHSNQQAWVHSDFVRKNNGTISQPTNPTPAPATTQKINAIVTASSLNVRSEGTLSGKVIGSLKQGENVTIIKEQNNWAEIEFGSSNKGWVAGWYLEKKSQNPTPTQTANENVTGNVMVLHNGTNIRSQPNTNSAVVHRASSGQSFPIIAVENDWYKIKLANGTEAYIAGWIVSTSGSTPSISRPGSEQYLKGKTIVIDAGHGGRDVGAIGVSGRYEKDLTLRTANLLSDKLKAAGANVQLTRANDTFLSLQGRVQSAHYHKADAFISVHYDSINDPSVTGSTTYYYHNAHKKLAESVHASLIQATKLRNRNVRQESYYILRENRQPSILLELGYISNRAEELTLHTNDYQERATTGIYNGLVQYFRAPN